MLGPFAVHYDNDIEKEIEGCFGLGDAGMEVFFVERERVGSFANIANVGRGCLGLALSKTMPACSAASPIL